MIASAFTCTGPYAILIMLGIKRVENRNVMPVPSKGRCAVSCSKSFCKEEYGEFVRWAAFNLPAEEFARIPAWIDVEDWPGKIVGTCNYSSRTRTDLVLNRGVEQTGTSNWDEGYDYWWDLSEVVCFDRPIPCRGNIGIWQLPFELAAQVSAADFLSRQIGERITLAEDAARVFHAVLPIVRESEGFFILPLDEERRVLSELVLVSLGTSSRTTAVQHCEVFSEALAVGAKAIIVAHNHPSGNLAASMQDEELTKELEKLGAVLGIAVIDHLILGRGCDFASLMRKTTL